MESHGKRHLCSAGGEKVRLGLTLEERVEFIRHPRWRIQHVQRLGGSEEHIVFRESYLVCIPEAESGRRVSGVKLKGWFWLNILKTLEC